MTDPHSHRLDRLNLALDGLSVGDAFGAQFFIPANRKLLFGPRRMIPPPVWGWTDDTEMALGLAETLVKFGEVDRDDLARVFAFRYNDDIMRGYGPGAHTILSDIHNGMPWREAAKKVFGGTGSMGNGSAMRVAPLSAWFADDLDLCARQARLSAEVTHCHPEGVAGAVAVAVAGAYAWQIRERLDDPAARGELFAAVLDHTPEGATRRGVAEAAQLDPESAIDVAVQALGNGSKVTAPDTVPLCVWLACRHLHNYVEGLWAVVKCGGDIDTNGAIVGGIVALASGPDAIPAEWLASREPLLRTRG